MKLATFLLENEYEHNGHKQTELGVISFDTLMEIMSSLKEESPHHLFYTQLFTDGSGSVEQGCYWREGEHPNGHIDRTIFGFQLKGGGE